MAHKKAHAVLVESHNLSFDGLLGAQPILRLSMRNTDTVGRTKVGPILVPPDSTQCSYHCTKPVLFWFPCTPSSYSSSLHNSFPIFQHGNIKYCTFIILCSSYLLERQCKGFIAQFLWSGHH